MATPAISRKQQVGSKDAYTFTNRSLNSDWMHLLLVHHWGLLQKLIPWSPWGCDDFSHLYNLIGSHSWNPRYQEGQTMVSRIDFTILWRQLERADEHVRDWYRKRLPLKRSGLGNPRLIQKIWKASTIQGYRDCIEFWVPHDYAPHLWTRAAAP
jgi:hypothetical protein